MATHSIPQDRIENQLIGNILAEEGDKEFSHLRIDMGKSISAPPPGFTEALFSSSPDLSNVGFNEVFSPNNKMPLTNSANSPDYPPQKSIWKQESYELGSFGQTTQIDSAEFQDPNSSMYSNSSTDSFVFPLIQRPHSQSLHFPNYQAYANSLSQDQYFQMRNKLMHPIKTHQQSNQGFQNRFQPAMDGSMPLDNQYHPNSQSSLHSKQGNSLFPRSTLDSEFFETLDFQIERKYSADPALYMRNSMKNQIQSQQQRKLETKSTYFGTPPFLKQNTAQNQSNGNYLMANKKKQSKILNSKRTSSSSNLAQSFIRPESPSYYPVNFQQDISGPYADNTYLNGAYHSSFVGSPTKGNMPLNMKYILSNLLEACKDQNGSRIIQQYFEKADREEKERIFQQIISNGYGLMADMFGNYVIQRILEIGTIQQKLEIYKIMKGKIFVLSQHTYSCRVIQKALEEFKNNGPVQDEILKELSTDILCLVEDQNGNHVIQKCIATIPAEKLRFIIDKVTEKIEKLPFHPFGCRVIQKILEYSTFEQTAPLLKKIMAKCLECCESQYGNYIMQYILEKGPHAEKQVLLEVLKNNFIRLSLNKFASNVTEKSAIHANAEFRQEVVDIIINKYYENKLGLISLMGHPFGNYVLQRVFECSDKNLRKKIYEAVIKPENFEEIKKTNYGKHVTAFIEKLMDIQKD